MDDDFRILFDYVEQMKRELQDEADLQSKSAEDEEKKCVHESIETEEAYVRLLQMRSRCANGIRRSLCQCRWGSSWS